MKSKLCYVLPEAASNTHMKYNMEFLKALAPHVDIYLIIEKGELKEDLGVTKVYRVKSKNIVIRTCKTVCAIIGARMKGYNKVYVHYSFVSAIVASLIPKTTVYYWNCGMPWQYQRPYLSNLYQGLAYKLIDHLVTGAPALVDPYAKYYKFNPAKAIVVPNWIDVEEFKKSYDQADREEVRKEYNISREAKVLFFMQRLSERKGAYYIIPILKNMDDDTVMIVTGDGPYKSTLEELVKKENLESNIRILGRVSNSKMPQIFKASDVFILPSDEEGMSHALMESMAAGVAAVSYDVGGTIDMYPEGYKQYVLKPKDVEVFSHKVKELLENESERQALGQALFKKVREYDKGVVVNTFIKSLEL